MPLMEKTAPPIKTFVDIKGHWGKMMVELMASLGIVRGIVKITLLMMPVNRVQLTAFLSKKLLTLKK